MANDICIFKRTEKKYMLSPVQKERLLGKIGRELIPDPHGLSTVCSTYFDTPGYLLIRNSIDAVSYKEKLRLRSYGVPNGRSQVFLELKKKYNGVVYKRREIMKLCEAVQYIESGVLPRRSQIFSEIDYAMRLYKHPRPAVLIAYEREAYFVKDLPNLRLTFDSGVRYRADNPLAQYGDHGRLILPRDRILLEIKTDGAMPVSFSRALDDCGIFPISFSKYGTAYRDICKYEYQKSNSEGVMKNVSNF